MSPRPSGRAVAPVGHAQHYPIRPGVVVMAKRRIKHLGRIVALAAVYVAVARLGLLMDPVSGFASLVWPPAGVALAALAIFGRELWPGVAIGAFSANLSAGGPLLAALGIGVGNTLEALVSLFLLRRFACLRDRFDRLRHAIGLIVFAAALASTVSATIGVGSLYLAGALRAGFGETWRAWWFGDAIGVIVVGSLLLSWAGEGRLNLSWRRFAEATVLGAALVGVTAFVFIEAAGRAGNDNLRLPYLIFPIVFLIALRFGMRGATTALFVTSVIAVTGTAFEAGPFVGSSLGESLEGLQVYIAIVGATALSIGATISEWMLAVQARDDLLAVVSHDLKSPLSAIRMSAELVRRTASHDDGRLQRHLDLVQRSTDRMNAIIHDLLDAAAIDVGRFSLSLREEDACALVDEAVELAQPGVGQKRHTLTVDKRCGRLAVVCDRERVLRVLANLIGNATKYTPEGGSIRLTVEPSGRAACFSVTDTGVGMSEAQLRRIFEPYYQAAPGTCEGSGLGLFIARGIVEAHGGRLWADSEEGVGSTFQFTLPLSRQGSSDGSPA